MAFATEFNRGPVVTGVMLQMWNAPTSVDLNGSTSVPGELEIYGSKP